MEKRIIQRTVRVLLIVVFTTTISIFVPAQSRDDAARVQGLFDSGNSLIGKGNFQEAIDKYSEVITIAPTWPLPYINRGIANLSLSKLSEALSDADKALSLLASGSFPKAQSALAYNLKGMIFLKKGDALGSIEFFKESIQLEPTNAMNWSSRGNSYQVLKRFDEALADYNKAIEIDRSYPEFFVNRATINQYLKNYANAISDVDEALKLDKNDSVSFFTRGNIYMAQGKLTEALADYDQAISVKPRSEYYYNRGIVNAKLGKWDAAVLDNTDAVKLDPRNTSAYVNRGSCYIRLGKKELAVEDYRKVVALNETSAQGRYGLAYLLYLTGQFPSALAEVNQVISIAPNWRSALRLRSAIYTKMGNISKSKLDSETAAKLTSDNTPTESSFFIDLNIFVSEEKQK